MSSGLMFDDIIINIFRNKEEKQHMEFVEGYFTKTEDNKNNYIGSLQYFNWKKDTLEMLDFLSIHYNVER